MISLHPIMDMTLCKGACGRKDGFEVGKAIDHDGECRHQLARGHVSEQGPDVARRCCFRVRLDEMVLNTKEAWASKLRARLIDLTVPPAK